MYDTKGIHCTILANSCLASVFPDSWLKTLTLLCMKAC